MKRPLAALAFVALAAAPALADPKSDLLAAFAKFNGYTSYHMTATTQGKTADLDWVPPAKIHMLMGPNEMIKIDQTVWVKAGAKWRQFAIPGMDRMMTNLVGPTAVTKGRPEDFSVTDLGMKSPEGVPLHAYSVVNTAMKEPVTVYLDAGGSIVRLESAKGDVLRISQVNAVTIAPPM